jgi:hypothetical protein
MSSRSRDLQMALPEDSQGMLDLLEDTPSKGGISLIYTRRPDPWESYMREGDRVLLAVTRSSVRQRIDGMAACAVNDLYLGGKPAKIAYLFGLRLREEAVSRIALLPRGYRQFLDILNDEGVSCAYTTILEGNLVARRMLEKRRASMPVYEYAGDYEIFSLTTGGSGRLPARHRFRRAGPEDEPPLLDFLNREGRRQLFFPCLTRDALSVARTTPSLSDFYILEDGDREIVCAGAVWDQRDYKQYIVDSYHGPYRWAYPFSSVSRLFGYPRLSPPGSVLPFFTLSCFAAKADKPAYFDHFLHGIREAGRRFDFFLVGLHERHPLREVVRRRPHIVYRSRLYLVYEDKAPRRLEPDAIPYLECGRL